MPCTGNLVCFECRASTSCPTWRHVTYAKPWLLGIEWNVLCTQCNKPMIFIGPSIEVPPKQKKKEWRKLFERIEDFRAKLDQELRVQYVNTRREIESEISELKKRPENKDRTRIIQELESRIKLIRKDISSRGDQLRSCLTS